LVFIQDVGIPDARLKSGTLLNPQFLKTMSRTMSRRRSICDNLEKDCLVANAAPNVTHT
jgi:hypothetical protein